MTINYSIECPVCKKVTRVRSPAGYVYKTPVRIHCGNCATLMTGHFISDNESIRAFYEADNACDVTRKNLPVDYYGEVSAEVLTHKCCNFSEMDSLELPCQSPAMIALQKIEIEDNESFINYICYLESVREKWSVLKAEYDLFINQRYDFIKEHCKEEAEQRGCDLKSEFQIQRFFNEKFFYDVAGLWKPKEMQSLMRSINYEFRHLNKLEIQRIIEKITPDVLKEIQKKLFLVFYNYVHVSLYLAPALSTFYYKCFDDVDYERYGLSTCSFEDIKGFYQDTFEDLCRYCYIVKMLDNVKYRGSYDATKNGEDFADFQNKSNGIKIKDVFNSEFFGETLGIAPDMNVLRNGIGHNNYTYDGMNQILDYIPNPKKSDVHQRLYLLEIAQRCLKLMRSAVILEFYIYELLREYYRTDEEDMSLPIWIYKGISTQKHCPCGSGKKYGKCCKGKLAKQNQNTWEYPKKACMRMSDFFSLKENMLRIPFNNK